MDPLKYLFPPKLSKSTSFQAFEVFEFEENLRILILNYSNCKNSESFEF